MSRDNGEKRRICGTLYSFDDPSALSRELIGVGMNGSQNEAEQASLQALELSDRTVREVAVTTLGHSARVNGAISEEALAPDRVIGPRTSRTCGARFGRCRGLRIRRAEKKSDERCGGTGVERETGFETGTGDIRVIRFRPRYAVSRATVDGRRRTLALTAPELLRLALRLVPVLGLLLALATLGVSDVRP